MKSETFFATPSRPCAGAVTLVSVSRMPVELDKIECAAFAACLDQPFAIATGAGPMVLRLVEACALGPRAGAQREPFSLIFRGEAALRLRQGIYQLRHDQLGEMEIFLVQIGGGRIRQHLRGGL